MLSSPEDGHVVWQVIQTLDTNSCRWDHWQNYTLCMQERGLGPVNNGGLQTATKFSLWDSHQEGIQHFLAFRSILSKISAEFGGQPRAPWQSGRKVAFLVSPPLHTDLNETSETELFCLEPFSPSLFFFAPIFVFLLKYCLILPNFVINLMFKKKGNKSKWGESRHFIITLYTLNIYNFICQLYLSEVGGKL